MKTPPSRFLAPFLAACALALTSCGVSYDHRSYVRGTGFGTDHEPVPTHVTVVDRNGNAITSGYSNRDAFYYGRKYYGNRYYGGMLYGYNNSSEPYVSTPDTTYYFRPAGVRHY